MKNKEHKQNIPEALDDNALDNVCGGTDITTIPQIVIANTVPGRKTEEDINETDSSILALREELAVLPDDQP